MNEKFILCIFIYASLRREEVSADEFTDHSSSSVSLCGEMDCYFGDQISCKEKCGCEKSIPYGFNATTGECELNLRKLMLNLAQRYKIQEKNRRRTESIFQGIMISGIIVVTWASVCLISMCYYCFRVKYMDHQLRNSVKEVARKLNTHKMATRNQKVKKEEFNIDEPTVIATV